MKMLNDKTALITGAARGIGKQIALLFASEGCNIAFTDLEENDLALQTKPAVLDAPQCLSIGQRPSS